MLKTWAMMGITTQGSKKKIYVTDMDTIERSNLNRQFLFRPENVGALKSETAKNAVLQMCPGMNIIAQSLKVAPETENVYTAEFWEGLDGVYTALDNVDARLYVDSRCVLYGKSMVDSGTLGTKGNTQAIIAFKTESYGSTRDPPEEGIPVCTLKHFPHKIEHTIQWARDLFAGEFTLGPEEVNSYISKSDYSKSFGDQQHQYVTALETVYKYLVNNRPLSFDDCVLWARQRFSDEFRDSIAQLIHSFPEDAVTNEGTPFWSGTKRAPQPAEFDVNDPLHLDFIVAAANLRAYNYGITGHSNRDDIKKIINNKYQSLPFMPRQTSIPTTEAEAKAMASSNTMNDDVDVVTSQISSLLSSLPTPQSMAGFRLNPVEFEKDNDANYHIAYITAASNLRAKSYRIRPESAHVTKFIAGKIIPAIATTTALVTGLVCLEMIKLREKKPIEDHRNTFVNLAINTVAASEPSPCAISKIVTPKGEFEHSLWDMDRLKGDITMKQLFDYVKDKYGVNPSILNYGPVMLYMDIGMGIKPHFLERLNVPLSKTVENINKKPLDSSIKTLQFDVSCVDDDDNDVEIPPIEVQFR